MSEDYLDVIIETSFGNISRREFLDTVDWPLKHKIFFKEIWKAMPYLSLAEISAIKDELGVTCEINRKAAREYLEKLEELPKLEVPSLSLDVDGLNPLASLSELGKTSAFPKMQRMARPDTDEYPAVQDIGLDDGSKEQDPLQQILTGDLGKTGAFPRVMRRSKPETGEYPAIEIKKTEEQAEEDQDPLQQILTGELGKTGAFPRVMRKTRPKTGEYQAVIKQKLGENLDAACKFCGQPTRFSLELAGKLDRCSKCRQPIEVPNPNFYLKRNRDTEIQGPYKMSRLKNLIEHDALRPGMLLSSDKKEWKALEDWGAVFVKLIVRYSHSQALRCLAVQKIKDQGFLGRCLFHENDPKVCETLLQGISDERLLIKICQRVVDQRLLIMALKKIEDQEFLKEFAKNTEHSKLCRFAISKLIDQVALYELANDMDEKVRKVALKKLTDQEKLKELVFSEPIKELKKLAITNLSNQHYLAEIAATIEDRDLKIAALDEVKDQSLLKELYNKLEDSELRATLITDINDQAFLKKILADEPDEKLRSIAVVNITDELLLTKIATEDISSSVQEAALTRITDPNSLERIARTTDRESIRQATLNHLDLPRLMEIARNGENREARKAATEKIKDHDFLAALFQESSDKDVRWIVVNNLSDQQLLAKIAVEDDDPLLCRLAESKVIEAGLISMIAAQANDNKVQIRAMAKLRRFVERCQDQAALARVLLFAKDQPLRHSALSKIIDEDWLARIIGAAAEPSAQQDVMAKITRQEIWHQLADNEREEVQLLVRQRLQPASSQPISPEFSQIVQQESIPLPPIMTIETSADNQSEAIWYALQQVAASDKNLLLYYLSPAAIQLLLQQYQR